MDLVCLIQSWLRDSKMKRRKIVMMMRKSPSAHVHAIYTEIKEGLELMNKLKLNKARKNNQL